VLDRGLRCAWWHAARHGLGLRRQHSLPAQGKHHQQVQNPLRK